MHPRLINRIREVNGLFNETVEPIMSIRGYKDRFVGRLLITTSDLVETYQNDLRGLRDDFREKKYDVSSIMDQLEDDSAFPPDFEAVLDYMNGVTRDSQNNMAFHDMLNSVHSKYENCLRFLIYATGKVKQVVCRKREVLRELFDANTSQIQEGDYLNYMNALGDNVWKASDLLENMCDLRMEARFSFFNGVELTELEVDDVLRYHDYKHDPSDEEIDETICAGPDMTMGLALTLRDYVTNYANFNPVEPDDQFWEEWDKKETDILSDPESYLVECITSDLYQSGEFRQSVDPPPLLSVN